MQDQETVDRTDMQSTIRFKTLEELHNAVFVFGREGDQSAEAESIDEIDPNHDNLVVGAFMMASHKSKGGFTQDVVNSIGTLETPYRSWDGPGPFHRASMYAAKEDGAYILRISVYGAENEPEVRLAETLGADIGYLRCRVTKTYNTVSDGRFKVPIKDITDTYKALGVEVSEEEAFKAFTTIIKLSSHGDEKLQRPDLVQEEGLETSVGFHFSVHRGHHVGVKYPEKDYEYRLENGYLTGPATYNDVKICFRAAPINTTPPMDAPTYDKKITARLKELGDIVENTWKANSTGPAPKPDDLAL